MAKPNDIKLVCGSTGSASDWIVFASNAISIELEVIYLQA